MMLNLQQLQVYIIGVPPCKLIVFDGNDLLMADGFYKLNVDGAVNVKEG